MHKSIKQLEFSSNDGNKHTKVAKSLGHSWLDIDFTQNCHSESVNP